jgi:hypothetical protein
MMRVKMEQAGWCKMRKSQASEVKSKKEELKFHLHQEHRAWF